MAILVAFGLYFLEKSFFPFFHFNLEFVFINEMLFLWPTNAWVLCFNPVHHSVFFEWEIETITFNKLLLRDM
jgi:hypothetical protein